MNILYQPWSFIKFWWKILNLVVSFYVGFLFTICFVYNKNHKAHIIKMIERNLYYIKLKAPSGSGVSLLYMIWPG